MALTELLSSIFSAIFLLIGTGMAIILTIALFKKLTNLW